MYESMHIPFDDLDAIHLDKGDGKEDSTSVM